MNRSAPVVSVEGLGVAFGTPRGTIRVLDDVGFDIGPGEAVALVGESGSGKSVTSLSLLGLLPASGRVVAGRIWFRRPDGEAVDLASAAPRTLRAVRGAGIGMIFQEPMSALNPSFTVGEQIAETIRLHGKTSRAEAWTEAERLLDRVGVADPARRLRAYPHQLSGGMRQRVMIAIAIACRPALLIADEPTTALDVTTQARILAMLEDLRRENAMGVLFVTHNLAVAAMIADRVMVMYAGQIVETGPADAVLASPRHPYTRALLDCLPGRHLPRDRDDPRPLPTIEGAPADLSGGRFGCAFAARCPSVAAACRESVPRLLPTEGGSRLARCWRVTAE